MITHQNPQSQKPIRVVLLGARGFIGTAIRRQIEAQDIPVIALTSAELDLAEAAAADRLAALLKLSDAVVMLAALTPDKGRDIATLMKNLAMMQSVCAALEKSGCAHLVYFSSDAVYDTAVSRVTEDTPASPQDLYGAMHYTREIMARSLAKIPVLVLRPTLVYGSGDTHNSYGPNRFSPCRAKGRENHAVRRRRGDARSHSRGRRRGAHRALPAPQEYRHALTLPPVFPSPFTRSQRLVAKQFGNGIEVITTPRANPITQRHYDVTNLIKAFPDFRFIAPEDGIARVHKESIEAA